MPGMCFLQVKIGDWAERETPNKPCIENVTPPRGKECLPLSRALLKDEDPRLIMVSPVTLFHCQKFCSPLCRHDDDKSFD